MRGAPLRRIVPMVVLALLASGCGLLGGDQMVVTATFDDVVDLVEQASVRAGDVTIGTVTDIELTDDEQALVTMEVLPDTGLPHDTVAWLQRTSLLGERYIDLRPAGETGRLEDGQHIGLDDTRIVTDFEDLVTAGNEVLAFVAADQLAAAVETGATAFGGRGALIGTFLEDVEAVVGRYRDGEQDLVRVIDSLDELTQELAPKAESNAEALATLREASDALGQQDDRLLDALDDLQRLSTVGERILADHRQQIVDAVRRLRIVLDQVTRIDGALQNFLTWVPRHNIHVPNGVYYENGTGLFQAQVWLDFIVCGEQDRQGDASRDCTPPNPGERAPQPPYHPTTAACWDDLDECEYMGDGETAGGIP